MNKLEVGMHVRTKNGITQYKKYKTTRGDLLCMPLKNGTFANIEDIINASFNIIDLIEVGDYVNGHRIIQRSGELMLEDTFDLVEDEDIKSIVTKEQFEAIKYEVNND